MHDTNDNTHNPVLDLIDELGIELLPQEEQEEFLGEISDALFESVLLHAAVQFSDEDRDTLSTLIDRASGTDDNDAHQEAVLSFLRLKVASFDDLVRAEAADLKVRYDALRQEVEQAQ